MVVAICQTNRVRVWLAAVLLVSGCSSATGDSRTESVSSDEVATASTPVASLPSETSPPAVEPLELSSDRWASVPEGPTARSNALGVWTGSEVLVVGGDPEPWCPPNADCAPPDFTQLTDGAAFDPLTSQWRPISEAPTPLGHWSSTAIVGDHLYVLVQPTFTASGRSSASFLEYDIVHDEWIVLPSPGGPDEWYRLVAGGEEVIAYVGSDEQGERPDRRFDSETQTWVDLPSDPFSPAYDRFMVSDGDTVTLFAKAIVPNPGSEGPSLADIAELDPSTGVWEVVGQAEVLWTESGHLLGDVVVFPSAGEADGGQVNNWGRSYPHGGVYDPGTGVWEDLPEPARTEFFDVAGVVNDNGAVFNAAAGSILDLHGDTWVDLPPLPDAPLDVSGRTTVAMGRSLFVFGGEHWADGEGRQTAAAFAIAPVG